MGAARGERDIMALIDSHPHPRVLFVGWGEDDPNLLKMMGLVATSQVWNGKPSSVRWADWDAVVARHEFSYAWGPHMVEVLAFGADTLPTLNTSGHSVKSGGIKQVSPEFETNDDLPDELRRLIRDDLAPWLRDQSARPLMNAPDTYSTQRLTLNDCVGDGATWFARDPDGTLIAGSYATVSGGRVWCVPFLPEHPDRWLAAALSEWHKVRPDVFPDRDPWRQRPQWMSRPELDAMARIEDAETELEALITTRRAAIETLGDTLRSAQSEADQGVRRLLTAQGDSELTAAVVQALTSFGFSVENRDDSVPKGTAKQEDLRVTPPGEGTGIAEVKGYTRGAKQSDLLKITKYATMFERETGQPPARQWYVCNQFLATDPDSRPDILAGADDDLAEFGTDGGVVIDTRELFKLIRSVEDGRITAEEARASLWNSPPRYVAPAQ